MSEAKAGEPAFQIGLGHVGALLFEVASNPCLAVDGKRWSCGAKRQISHAIIQRMIDGGWLAISPEKLMNREMVGLTEKGTDELTLYCMLRSIEITDKLDPTVQYAANGEDMMQAPADVAFDLATRAIEIAYRKRGELVPGGHVAVEQLDGQHLGLDTLLLKTEKRGERYAIMLGVLNSIAEQAMAGMTLAEMDSFAQWCGQMATIAFARAPQNAMDGDPGEEP